jgi:hypothetical protein
LGSGGMPNQYGTATRHSRIIGDLAAPSKNYGLHLRCSAIRRGAVGWSHLRREVPTFSKPKPPSSSTCRVSALRRTDCHATRDFLPLLEGCGKGRGPAASASKNVLPYAQAESVEETTPHYAQFNLPIFSRTPPVPFQPMLRANQAPFSLADSCITLEGEEVKLCRSS